MEDRTSQSVDSLFHDAFNASPVGIAVENLEGQPLFVNPALCAMLGFREEEMCGKHCVDFSPLEDAERDWELFQQLRDGAIDHYQLEKRFIRRDGSLLWGRLSISLLNGRPSPLVIAMVEDITDKKKAEEAQVRHAAIVASSEDGIISVTLDRMIVSWNPGAERMFGYTEAEVLGQPIDIIVPAELPDEENKILETLRTGGRIEHFETVRLTKTGKRINVSLSISPIKGPNGETVAFAGIARDITENKRAEQELATANERLRLAIESGSVGGWDFDLRTGKVVWFGKAHAQLGLDPDETSASNEEFWARVHEKDRRRLERALEVAKNRRRDFAEDFRVVWRDGTTHWLRSRGRYYYGTTGEPERMLGLSFDITASKQVEQALRESDERLYLAAQAAKIYSFEWDVTTDVVVRSPQRSKVLGDAEPRLTHRQFVETIHPDDRPRFLAAVDGLTHKNPIGEVIYRAVGSDGTYIWLKSSARAFFDSGGRLLRVIGIVADVTDLKLAEEALSGMTRKLIQAQEQERARIARDLHDDINQRLAMLAVKLEQQRDPSEFQNRVQEFRQEVSQISENVQALSHELHSSKLEYLGVVAGIKSWCKEFGERHRMEIECSSDVSSLLPLEIGFTLFRVLQEALHNANKHSGVKHVEVRLEQDGNEVHLSVRDSGRGFNVDAALQGKGLGLTSMRERVRLVNGTFTINSQPTGAGTTIHVSIPFESSSAERVAV